MSCANSPVSAQAGSRAYRTEPCRIASDSADCNASEQGEPKNSGDEHFCRPALGQASLRPLSLKRHDSKGRFQPRPHRRRRAGRHQNINVQRRKHRLHFGGSGVEKRQFEQAHTLR